MVSAALMAILAVGVPFFLFCLRAFPRRLEATQTQTGSL